MDCKYVQSQIRKFLDNQVKMSEIEGMTKHLAECVECRFVYQDVRQQLHDSENHEFPEKNL